MDCLTFVEIEISLSRQSIIRVSADLGEFCAAVLRRLATAKQRDSENQESHGDGPISHLIPPEGRTSVSFYPKPLTGNRPLPCRRRAMQRVAELS
jgi:hypothetical protein